MLKFMTIRILYRDLSLGHFQNLYPSKKMFLCFTFKKNASNVPFPGIGYSIHLCIHYNMCGSTLLQFKNIQLQYVK